MTQPQSVDDSGLGWSSQAVATSACLAATARRHRLFSLQTSPNQFARYRDHTTGDAMNHAAEHWLRHSVLTGRSHQVAAPLGARQREGHGCQRRASPANRLGVPPLCGCCSHSLRSRGEPGTSHGTDPALMARPSQGLPREPSHWPFGRDRPLVELARTPFPHPRARLHNAQCRCVPRLVRRALLA